MKSFLSTSFCILSAFLFVDATTALAAEETVIKVRGSYSGEEIYQGVTENLVDAFNGVHIDVPGLRGISTKEGSIDIASNKIFLQNGADYKSVTLKNYFASIRKKAAQEAKRNCEEQQKSIENGDSLSRLSQKARHYISNRGMKVSYTQDDISFDKSQNKVVFNVRAEVDCVLASGKKEELSFEPQIDVVDSDRDLQINKSKDSETKDISKKANKA